MKKGPTVKPLTHALNLEIGQHGDWVSESLIEPIGTYTSDATGETVQVYLTLSRSRVEISTTDGWICRVPLEALMDRAADALLQHLADIGRRGTGLLAGTPVSPVPPDPTLDQTPATPDLGKPPF